MLRLVRGFLEAQRAVDLVLFQAAGEYLNEIPDRACVVDLSAPRVFGGLAALGRYLALAKPRALISAHTHINVAAAMAKRMARTRVRHIASERNQISEKAASARGMRARAVYAAAPFAYRATHRVVAVSNGVARDLRAFTRLPESKISVVYNPVFDATLQARLNTPMAHAWADDGGPPFVLAAGRLAPQKDFATLLRAFAIVRRRHALRLLILGEGPMRKELEALAGELCIAPSEISLPGFVANPLPYMARCSVFALSSRFEGFPNVLVEALAAGASIVSTKCPSGPDEILCDGEFGRLVPVGDAEAFAQALEKTLARPSVPHVQVERARHFSVERASEQYLNLLEEGVALS